MFLDTANLAEISTAARRAIPAGASSTPTVAGEEAEPRPDQGREITAFADGPESAEATAHDPGTMAVHGKELSQMADNVVVEVPLTREGVAAGSRLVDPGIPINVAFVFSPVQALLAASIGATSVSPFLGRVDDIANDVCVCWRRS